MHDLLLTSGRGGLRIFKRTDAGNVKPLRIITGGPNGPLPASFLQDTAPRPNCPPNPSAEILTLWRPNGRKGIASLVFGIVGSRHPSQLVQLSRQFVWTLI